MAIAQANLFPYSLLKNTPVGHDLVPFLPCQDIFPYYTVRAVHFWRRTIVDVLIGHPCTYMRVVYEFCTTFCFWDFSVTIRKVTF